MFFCRPAKEARLTLVPNPCTSLRIISPSAITIIFVFLPNRRIVFVWVYLYIFRWHSVIKNRLKFTFHQYSHRHIPIIEISCCGWCINHIKLICMGPISTAVVFEGNKQDFPLPYFCPDFLRQTQPQKKFGSYRCNIFSYHINRRQLSNGKIIPRANSN